MKTNKAILSYFLSRGLFLGGGISTLFLYSNKDAYNGEILSIMLRYHVISPEAAEKLIDNDKLNFTGAEVIVNTFKEE